MYGNVLLAFLTVEFTLMKCNYLHDIAVPFFMNMQHLDLFYNEILEYSDDHGLGTLWY